MSRRAYVTLCLVFCLDLACNAALSHKQPPPELVVTNAHVLTMNPQQPSAEAMAIAGDRIVWVGSDDEARRRYPGASPLDLGGATVIPGIIDAHTHLLPLGESLIKVNLKDLPTESAIVERIGQKAATTPRGQWILGWGWDEGKWAAHYPTNVALSAVTPDHPVFLVGLHSFAGWANAEALEIAGVTKDTADPPNGQIIRDGAGTPTGILTNHAQALVTRHVPKLTLEQIKERLTLEEALRGYTQEAAYAEREERDKGSLEAGKLADFLVLSADITRLSPKEILELRAQRTYVGGKLVFQAPP